MAPVGSLMVSLGKGSGILDMEDFIVSNNILPIGSIIYILFCTRRYGWGWDNFIKEANAGKGIKIPTSLRWYLTYVPLAIILVVFVYGYVEKFMMWKHKGDGVSVVSFVMSVQLRNSMIY